MSNTHQTTTTAAAIGGRRSPYLSFILGGTAVLLYALPTTAVLLGYDRSAFPGLWRIFTCHWVHWNLEHLFWSAATFVVLGALCERENRRQFLACVVGSACAIPLALYALMPELRTYGGLSGVDAALFVLIAVTLLRERLPAREWSWILACAGLLLAFAGKVGFELATGSTVFVTPDPAMTPVPLAHAVGGAVGALVGLGRPPRSPNCQTSRSQAQGDSAISPPSR
jgi:rhomboid family GlyGly-CTERM serine protease